MRRVNRRQINQLEKNRCAYDFLDRTHLQWGRIDNDHIFVWTPGYKMSDTHYVIEERLKNIAGMMMISEEFDKMCGKTIAVYKEHR